MKQTIFMKRVYLGKYHGERVWLAPPSLDCGWYWGFGYIQNRNLHSHYDSVCLKKLERYNVEKQVWQLESDYCHKLNDSKDFTEIPFSETVLWKLSDYMQSFYALKEAAEVFGRGSSHVSGNVEPVLLDKAMCDKINNEMLPDLFDAIYRLLTEKQED